MDTSFNELRKKWLLLSVLKYKRLLISEAHLEPFQTPMMKLFLNIVSGFSLYFRQNVDVWEWSKQGLWIIRRIFIGRRYKLVDSKGQLQQLQFCYKVVFFAEFVFLKSSYHWFSQVTMISMSFLVLAKVKFA